jgi:hypothetical protein
MGYQPRKKLSRDAIHEYRKSLQEKSKNRKRIRDSHGSLPAEKAQIFTEKEISEATLRRLHTLGSQKFGSSPFSEHFNRWLTNVSMVLDEFQTHPDIKVDKQFVTECTQTLSTIGSQLKERRRQETSLDQELKNLAYCRERLNQINSEYAAIASKIRGQKNRDIRRINSSINRLKEEQEEVIRMKTGLFRSVSKKEREQKEIVIVEELNNKQTELEIVILDFKNQQKILQDNYEKKKEPVLEQIYDLKKKIRHMDMDDSLEDRWFACEALIDSINSFLQRKATGNLP